MNPGFSKKAGLAVLFASLAASLIAFFGCAKFGAGGTPKSGVAIYQDDCARCHGKTGEGVAGKYDGSLYGERSIASLAKYISKKMPDDDPGIYKGEVASNIAEYVYNAFYSRQARARNHPERLELAHLTTVQFLNSVADLVGSFREQKSIGTERGLEADYLDYHMVKDKQDRNTIFTRTDGAIDFDFGDKTPDPRIVTDQFSMKWRGSLIAEDTGWYEFRLQTRNGARLFLNADRNDAVKQHDGERVPFIDGWVVSGTDVRELTGRMFLLGGRAYPMNFEFFKSKEKTSSVRLEWKPPHRPWEVIPKENFAKDRAAIVTVVATTFPPDDSSMGYERGTSVAKEWDHAVTDAAILLANEISTHLSSLANAEAGSSDRDAKIKSFCEKFAARAFRRPLTDEQKKIYIEDQFAAAPDPLMAVKRVVLLVIKSPRFLYPDIGPAKPDDYSVASRLALSLWDSVPDQALRDAATAGKLHTPGEVSAQIRRMMADERVKFKVRGFFEHWLAMDLADEIAKDKKTYPDFDEAVVADTRESLQRFVEQVVWSDASDYRQLLLADYLFLNPRLAKFYGAPAPKGDGFEKISFDSQQRAGIFTHPYLLSAFAYSKNTSPIKRGVFLTRHVMGRFLKPPPKAMVFDDNQFHPSLTMRQKTEELTKKDTCMVCHAVINPIGFSLENYDAVGRYRTHENDSPVDPASDYPTSDGEVVELKGPRDLAKYAAESPEAQMGFVAQLFHHTVKQSPGAYGMETLDQMHDKFVKSGFNIREMLVEITKMTALHGVEETKQVAAVETKK